MDCCKNPYKHCRCAYAVEPCQQCEWETEHALWHLEQEEEDE